MTAQADRSAVVREQPQGRLPDFFIVGHAKSGTTALYEMLRRHPQVYMSDVKEPWYFVPELRSSKRRQANPRHPDTLEGYLALFAGAQPGQRLGEATPSYLLSMTAAARIAELQPDARIVAILREPASFLRSLHLQFLQAHVETEPDLRRALELEPLRREGKQIPPHSTRPQSLLYSEHVRYVEQLRRYHAVFPREQVLTLIYEDFRRDNEATLRRVLRFLDVDDTQPIEPLHANPTVQSRSPRTRELIRALSLARGGPLGAARKAITALTPKRVRTGAVALGERSLLSAEVRAPDERLMGELRARYKAEVTALGDYLDRDLVRLWGYDGIG
jgi:Sulfotransferase family